MKPAKSKYEKLLANIGSAIEQARANALRVINTELVRANWEIGRHIVEYEQGGEERAEYGSAPGGKAFKRFEAAVRQRIWQAERATSQSVSSFRRRKTKCWWSMRRAEFQIKYSFQNTSFICLTKINCGEK